MEDSIVNKRAFVSGLMKQAGLRGGVYGAAAGSLIPIPLMGPVAGAAFGHYNEKRLLDKESPEDPRSRMENLARLIMLTQGKGLTHTLAGLPIGGVGGGLLGALGGGLAGGISSGGDPAAILGSSAAAGLGGASIGALLGGVGGGIHGEYTGAMDYLRGEPINPIFMKKLKTAIQAEQAKHQ